MGPEAIRNARGFAGTLTSVLTLVTASPALAQGFSANLLTGTTPLSIALGAGAFALLALALIRRLVKDRKADRERAGAQIGKLRALVDEYEALLSGMPEVMVLWTENAEGPKFLGQASVLLPPGRRPEAILDFSTWLDDAEAKSLVTVLDKLKREGRAFDLSLRARDGRLMRAAGWVLGGGAALRIRPAFTQPPAVPAAAPVPQDATATLATARTVLSGLSKPAFLRDTSGKLVWVNAAYIDLATTIGRAGTLASPPELMEPDEVERHRVALLQGGKARMSTVTLGRAGAFDLNEFPVAGGAAGYLQPRADGAAPRGGDTAAPAHLSAIVDAMATPIAIFNARRELMQFNRAYTKLWTSIPAG